MDDMKDFNLRRFCLFISLGVLVLTAPGLYACSIPVFRYALERWQTDLYEIEIIHHGPLDGETKAAFELLGRYTNSKEGFANFQIRLKDSQENTTTPAQINVYFSGGISSGTNKPLWSRTLTRQTVKTLVDSPLRKEIVRRLLDGDSAVWILLKSGDQEKDSAAAAMLQEQLSILKDNLEISEPPTMEVYAGNELYLRPFFSLVHLARDDIEEAFLVASLLRTEPDLLDYSEPMAFPVFGRGHVLYALVGKGINPYNILQACEFIIGPCSCIVKAQNPGVDLLLAANWDEQLGPLLVAEEPLPPLTGVFSDSPEVREEQPDQPSQAETASGGSKGGSRLLWVVILTLSAILALAILGSVMIIRREKSRTYFAQFREHE